MWSGRSDIRTTFREDSSVGLEVGQRRQDLLERSTDSAFIVQM